ncbi:MAG: hypothetical protein K6B71_01095 [Alphaproteobacteria bacterium]|nr:hypothetical protein [Alphaproteobacteria bacterium]
MNTLSNFFKLHKHVITWTVIYVFLMWAVLSGVFNFDMFSYAHWEKMTTVQLHGFPGLVLGLLILSSVPLYIATAVVAARTKSLPVPIPLPKCFSPEPEKKPAPEPEVKDLPPEPDPLPNGAPMEMREKFAYARHNLANAPRQRSVFNRPVIMANPIGAAPAAKPEPSDNTVLTKHKSENPETQTSFQDSDTGLPLPSDFNFDQGELDKDSVPVFSDINFDDDFDSDDGEEYDDTQKENTKFFEYVKTLNKNAEIDGNLIICGDTAIAVHTDSDFWVADEIDWFASGKQKPSPILELKKAKSEQNKQAILYLESSNIMDLDKLIPEWESDGIHVVTTLDEITKVVCG